MATTLNRVIRFTGTCEPSLGRQSYVCIIDGPVYSWLYTLILQVHQSNGQDLSVLLPLPITADVQASVGMHAMYAFPDPALANFRQIVGGLCELQRIFQSSLPTSLQVY